MTTTVMTDIMTMSAATTTGIMEIIMIIMKNTMNITRGMSTMAIIMAAAAATKELR